MALRDIFDSDPRSKDQLRKELAVLAQSLSEQSSQALSLQETGQLQTKALLTANRKLEELAGELAEMAGELTNSQQLNTTLRTQVGDLNQLSEMRVRLVEREALVLKNFTELVRREQRMATDLNYPLGEPLVHVRFGVLESNEILDLRGKVALLENMQSGNRPGTSDQTLSNLSHEVRVDELERANLSLRQDLDRAKSVIQQFPPFGTPNVNGAKTLHAASEQIANLTAERDRKTATISRYEVQIRLHEGTVNGLREELKEAATSLRDGSKQKDQEIHQLRDEYITLQSRISNWTLFHSKRETALARRENAIKEKLASLKVSNAKVFNLPTFTQEEILVWMFSETHPDDLHVSHGYLHLMGDGPWGNDAFGRLMEVQDFSLWKLPDADIAHLVVGRNNWSEDDLIAQIEARQGQTLRIYSQEMWSAAMATGRDPFDAEDPDLLQAFANGHEALEFLIGQEIPWPNVSDQPPGKVTVVEPGELGVRESPMHMMDYCVGETSPHSEEERHAILDEIFCSRNLPYGDDCSPTYRANWGTPKSAQRLYRMAIHIKFIVDGPSGRDYRRLVAREDWINDLAWLKKTYFRKTVHAFQWPSTHVP